MNHIAGMRQHVLNGQHVCIAGTNGAGSAEGCSCSYRLLLGTQTGGQEPNSLHIIQVDLPEAAPAAAGKLQRPTLQLVQVRIKMPSRRSPVGDGLSAFYVPFGSENSGSGDFLVLRLTMNVVIAKQID